MENTPLNTDHTSRFTGRVAGYEQYRQRYPAQQVLQHLRDWCGLNPTDTIADIGAGTGMLSEVFLQNGNTVIAVEPNQEMRGACEALANKFTKLTIVAATAEETTLPDHSVDMVSAGRAFHWFDAPRAISEFQRILRPGGWIALVAQGRGKKDGNPQQQEFEDLLLTYGTDQNYIRGGHRTHENLEELFPGGEVRRTEIHGEQQLTEEQFLGETQSYSIVPLPTDPRHPAMLAALQSFFHRHARNGLLTMPTTCWITCARFASK